MDVEFLKPIMEPEVYSKKQSVVDVLCRDADKCQYIIEMQVAKTSGFEERAQYYAYKTFVNQLNKGDGYSKLKEVIFLAFTDFSMFPQNAEYKSEHVTLDTKTYKRHLDKISFTFVDLVKFDEQRPRNIASLSLEEKFYYFLKHADDVTPEELDKLVGKNEVIKQAFKELDHFYWTEQEMINYESDLKGQRDNKAAMDYVLEYGMEKGREEGKKEGIAIGEKRGEKIEKEKIIVKMIENGMSIDSIKQITGISEKDILKKMKEKV